MEIQLHDKQMEVLQALLQGRANELLYGGAMGGGKSYMLRALAIIIAMEVPRCNIYLFRRVGKDLIATHMRGPSSFPVLLDEFINDKLVNINKASSTIEWSNGSVIVLNHIQYEQDLDRYLSSEIHVALFDESTTFTPKMIKFIRSRVRLGSLIVPEQYKKAMPFIVYATNPRGASHLYFKSNFVDIGEPMVPFKAPDADGGMTRMYVPAKLDDNPTLTENDPSYRTRALGMGDPDVVKAYLEGDWSCTEGAAFPTFSRKYHVLSERSGDVGDVDVSRAWPMRVAYDYGFSAPYSVLFYMISSGESEYEWCPPKGSLIIYGEIYGDNAGDEVGRKEEVAVTASRIKAKAKLDFDREIHPGPADSAIFNQEQGPSISSIFYDNGVVFTRSNKRPGSRILGLALIRRLLFNSINFPKEKPGIYIMSSCPRLIQHIAALSLDTKTGEDVETTQPDHDYDVLRYIVLDKESEARVVELQGV
jgi:hypothetical protein